MVLCATNGERMIRPGERALIYRAGQGVECPAGLCSARGRALFEAPAPVLNGPCVICGVRRAPDVP